MFCHVAQRSFSDFSVSLEASAIRERTPFMGALELTYRCNLACRHCYCNLALNDRRKKDELATAEIKRILDEAADAGCLWLLLTGGEVLVREDFRDIYLHAVKKGMFVEVFTNATLLDDTTASYFGDFPPFGIDISIYGSKPSLHDMVTGVRGSFDKTIAALARLQKHKVKFSLKTMLMTLNYDDLSGMQKLALDMGAELHFDTLVSPRTDGGLSPTRYRLNANTIVGLDLDEEKDFKACEDVFDSFWNKPSHEALNCGAGIFAFNINPYGSLSPCTMFSSFQYPLKEISFKMAWNSLMADYGSRQNDYIPDACKACTMLLICSHCAAWAETETGKVNKKVKYLCEYAKCLERKFFDKKRR